MRHGRRTCAQGGDGPAGSPGTGRVPAVADGQQGTGFQSVMCACSMSGSSRGLSLPCQVSHTLFSHVSGLIGVLTCLPIRQSGRIPCHFADSTSARRFCCAALPPGVVHFCDVTCCNVRVTNVRTPGPGWQEGPAPCRRPRVTTNLIFMYAHHATPAGRAWPC